MPKRRWFIFTYQHCGLPLALRLQDEGEDVALVLIEPEMAEDKWKPPRDKKELEALKRRKQYLAQNADGLVKKIWGREAMGNLSSVHRANTYVIFDQIHGFRYGEVLRRRGLKVLGGSAVGYQLEMEREKTLRLLAGLGFAVPLQKKFGPGSAERAVAFLKDIKDRVLFALKSDNPAVMTHVAAESNEELIQKLQAEKKEIDRDNFILQQKVEGIEAAVETWYCGGRPVLANVDLEAKRKYNEMSDVQTGCSFDLLWVVPVDHPLRQLANAPLDAYAKKHIGTGLLDLGFIYQPQEQKIYALEVCGSRFAYNALYTLLALRRGRVADFLADFMDERYRRDISSDAFMLDRFGASLRIFNDESQADQPISYPREDAPHIWLWDAHRKGGRLYTTGDESIGILTAAGENPESAFAQLRERFFRFHCPVKWARDDFDEEDTPTLPLARYHALKKLGLA